MQSLRPIHESLRIIHKAKTTMEKLTPEQRLAAYEKAEEGHKLLEMCRTHCCLECKGILTVAINIADGSDLLRCAADKNHQGFRKKLTNTEIHDSGVWIPYVSERIEARRKKK